MGWSPLTKPRSSFCPIPPTHPSANPFRSNWSKRPGVLGVGDGTPGRLLQLLLKGFADGCVGGIGQELLRGFVNGDHPILEFDGTNAGVSDHDDGNHEESKQRAKAALAGELIDE